MEDQQQQTTFYEAKSKTGMHGSMLQIVFVVDLHGAAARAQWAQVAIDQLLGRDARLLGVDLGGGRIRHLADGEPSIWAALRQQQPELAIRQLHEPVERLVPAK